MLAVIVLYCCSPGNSPTIETLRRILPPFSGRIQVFVYDNSPEPLEYKWDDGWSYRHNGSNGGLAAAYNAALQIAKSISAEWLLLLDQDSSLSDDFLEKTFLAIEKCDEIPMAAAIVPRIYVKDMLISPSQWRLGRCIRERNTGLRSNEVTALNSGSLIRVGVISELAGFNSLFWLDYLDYWLYHEIHAHGYRVFVSQASLAHNLSLLSKTYVNRKRYANILAAEMLFTNTYRPRFERIIYLIRLILRCFEQMLGANKRHVALLTFKAAIRELTFLLNG